MRNECILIWYRLLDRYWFVGCWLDDSCLMVGFVAVDCIAILAYIVVVLVYAVY